MNWFHLKGTICIAGHDPETAQCVEGFGTVINEDAHLELERLRRFEAMWEDCRQHRDHAEARARRYMGMVQQVAAIVAPDEEGAL